MLTGFLLIEISRRNNIPLNFISSSTLFLNYFFVNSLSSFSTVFLLENGFQEKQ